MKPLAIGLALLLWWALAKHDQLQEARITHLEKFAICYPEQDGQIAALSLHNGVVECAVTGKGNGGRKLLSRREL